MSEAFDPIDSEELDAVAGGRMGWRGRAFGTFLRLLGWNDEAGPDIEPVQPNQQTITRTMDPPRPQPLPGGRQIRIPGRR